MAARLLIPTLALVLLAAGEGAADEQPKPFQYPSAAIDLFIEKCAAAGATEEQVRAEWTDLHDEGRMAHRIYTLVTLIPEPCLVGSLREAVLAIEKRQRTDDWEAATTPQESAPEPIVYRPMTYSKRLTKMPKYELYATRIGHGVGGGVCMGVGLALMGAAGASAAVTQELKNAFGSYSPGWTPYRTAAVVILGAAGVIMVPIATVLLFRASLASWEFDRREASAVLQIGPGRVTAVIRW